MSFCVTHDSNLQQNALQFLFDRSPKAQEQNGMEPLGGILSTLNYAWLVKGARIIVVKCKSGTQIGSWDFGVTLQDPTSTIISVDEIHRPHRKEPLLAIAINCELSGGIICIFDFVGSKVLRSIQIGEHISNLHIVNGSEDFNLSGPLTNFDGILAVGTLGGNLYILDICKQLCYEESSQIRDETNPCQVHIISSADLIDIENHKKNAVCNEAHLAIHLNLVADNVTEHFVLKTPDGKDKVHVNKKEVSISALHYCHQLGSILVGFNFGAFQLWDLMCMELIYTSPICEDHVPVSKFAIQEPSDDPRAFCYIWAVYSSDDLDSSLLPYLVMYALCYESKEFHEAHGILYENFQYCAVRFQMELGLNDQSNIVPQGGKCLKLESLIHKHSSSSERTEDLLSLCVVIWRAVCDDGQFTYMSVFDLNQWYKAQMPNSSNFEDCLSYMITLCVTDLTNTVEESALVLDIAVNNRTIQQFIATQRLEEHYYPSALSFDTSCLLYNKCIVIRYQGVQKALLYQIHSDGPFCLIRPTDIYQEIVTLGMIPLFCETSATSTSPVTISLNSQREVILNVALEQQLMNWLCKCVSEWANGSFSSAGCSLDLLISWAYRRWVVLKNNCDKLCVPLFDYSNMRLDTNTLNILNNCIRQLKNISFFYSYLSKNFLDRITDSETLLKRSQTFQTVAVYYDVLQWLLNVGFLPEHSPSTDFEFGLQEEKVRAPYPADELVEHYRRRRSEVHLNSGQCFRSMNGVLFVDNLIDIECGGDRLGRDWRDDGGDGLYPPRSLQALLRTYLIDGIEMSNKHLVVIYLFLDLARVLDSQRYASVITHLIKFPAVFKVSPSLIKITQGFWQLDHDDFATAMEHLLDPLVNKEDVKNWHHRVALKSLIAQEQYNFALYYMRVRKPPILEDEDVLSALSLYVACNMLDEAFHLQKSYSNYPNSRNFIRYLFEECSKHGFLDKLIQRNLSEEEEELFLRYLDEIDHPQGADLKITYFMQKSHYLEAFRTYEACGDDPTKKGLLGRLRSKTRDRIVHTYKKMLPTVSYKFIEQCMNEPNPTLWKEVSKQEPMSTFVHKMEGKTDSQLSFYLAALVKAKQTFNGAKPNSRSLMTAKTEDIPFLRTPTTFRSRKRSLSSPVRVLVPRIVEDYEETEDYGPSPSKKRRLIPKTASVNSYSSINIDASVIGTPIIKRKDNSRVSPIGKSSIDLTATPTSILKNASVISGRRSISRISTVRFDVPKSPTSSEETTPPISSRTSGPSLSSSPREKDSRNSSKDSISFNSSSRSSFSRSLTPKNVSDDVFYSPNSSLNNVEEIPKDDDDEGAKEIEVDAAATKLFKDGEVHGHGEEEENDEEVAKLLVPKISPRKSVVNEAKLVKLVDYEMSSNSSEECASSSSPRARRSYKSISNESVRSSPRLGRSRENASYRAIPEEKLDREKPETGEDTSRTTTDSSDYKTTSENYLPLPKIKPRKSLSRQVLENNAFTRLSTATVRSTTSSSSLLSLSSTFRSGERSTAFSAEIDRENSEFASTEIVYSDVYRKESGEEMKEKHSVEKRSIAFKEISLESDNETGSFSIDSAPAENDGGENEDCVMEELIEDLRQRRSRGMERSFGVEREDDDRSETPSRTTRRSSSRLSTERTIQRENSTSKSDEEKINNTKTRRTRASAEKSLLKTNNSVSSSPRFTRRMSEERTIAGPIEANRRKTRSSSEREILSPRLTTRRLSMEISKSSENTSVPNNLTTSTRSGGRSSSEREVCSPRVTRRWSAERSLKEDSKKETVELIKLTPRSKTPTKSLSKKVLEVDNTSQRMMTTEEQHGESIISKDSETAAKNDAEISLGNEDVTSNEPGEKKIEEMESDPRELSTEDGEHSKMATEEDEEDDDDPDLSFLKEKRSSYGNPELSLSDSLLEFVNRRTLMNNDKRTTEKSDESCPHPSTIGDEERPNFDVSSSRAKNDATVELKAAENVKMIVDDEAGEMLRTIEETSMMFGSPLNAEAADLDEKEAMEKAEGEEEDDDDETFDVYADFASNVAEITDDLDVTEFNKEDGSKKELDVAFLVEESSEDSAKTVQVVSDQSEGEGRARKDRCGSGTNEALEQSNNVYANLENVKCNEWNLLESNIFGRLEPDNTNMIIIDGETTVPFNEISETAISEKKFVYTDSSLSDNEILSQNETQNDSETKKLVINQIPEIIELNSTTEEEDSVFSKTSTEESSSNSSSSESSSNVSRSEEKEHKFPGIIGENVSVGAERENCEAGKISTEEKIVDVGGNRIRKDDKLNYTLLKTDKKLEDFESSGHSENPSKRNIELQTGKSLLEIEEKPVRSGDAAEKNDIILSSRRKTRRSSNLSDEEKVNLKLNKEEQTRTPKRSRRQRLSVDPVSPSEVNLEQPVPESSPTSKNIRTYTRNRTKSVDAIMRHSSDREGGDASKHLEAPAKRKLRSASVDLCFTESAPYVAKTSKEFFSVESENSTLPRQRNRRKSSSLVRELPVIAEEKRKSKRKPDNPMRRNLRSASMDESDSRSASLRADNAEERSEKSASVSEFPVGKGADKKKRRKPEKTVKKDLIESYTLTRRMTRRQVNMLEKCMRGKEDGNLSDLPEEPESSNSNDEKLKVDTSPSSSNTSYTRRTRRSSVSSSVASGHSSSISSPKKNKITANRTDSPLVIERRKRLRSASSETLPDGSGKSRRTRAGGSSDRESTRTDISGTSTISQKSKRTDSSSNKGKRKGVSVKRNLPKIKEENSSDS